MTDATTDAPTALSTTRKVTIYKRGEMMGNILKIEARSVTITRRPYAQYSNAIEVRFVKKGARRERGWVDTYRSSLLVLEGHGHPDPAGLFDESTKVTTGEGANAVTTARGRYASCDDGWARDFDSLISGHIEKTGAVVLWDTREEVIR